MYNGIIADSVSVDSDSQVTATFTKGIPISTGEISPSLDFYNSDLDADTDLSNEIYRTINDDTVTVSNALSISDYSSGITCSFAGGCSYEITADGLSNSIENLPEDNYITVCGIECEYDSDNSDDSTTYCTLPPLSTLYSDSSFTIEEETNDL
jgi:hypothetical protein